MSFFMRSKVAGKQTAGQILLTACAAALAITFMVAPLQPAHAADITPPSVPDRLKVLDGSKVFLVGHATGTQNYICLPSGTGFAFALFTPQATLFDDQGVQIITHFFSTIPDDNTAIRATWQFKDTSSFWGKVDKTATAATDPDFVDPNAVAWLLLSKAASQDGPNGGSKLTGTTFVQRINTRGGLAPSTGCSGSADVGNKAFVPYAADYVFFHKPS